MPSPTHDPAALLIDAVSTAKLQWTDGPQDFAPLDAYAVQIFLRSVRLAEAAAVLLKAHLPEEALFLGRSLFEDSLRLSDLAREPDSRQAYLLGWVLSSLQQARGLAHDAVFAGLDASPAEMLAAVEVEQAKVNRFALQNGNLRARRFRSPKDAAAVHGRTQAFWTYSLAHEMVHGSDLSFMFSRKVSTADMLTYGVRTENARLELGVACFCAESTLHSGIALAVVYGRPGIEVLRCKLADLEALEHASVSVVNP